MKNGICLILLLSAVVGAHRAFADLPKNDPVVAALQKDFDEGKVPSERELKAGKYGAYHDSSYWYCTYYEATSGRSDVVNLNDTFRFDWADGGLITNKRGSLSVKTLAYAPEGLKGIANTYGCPSEITIRMGQHHKLIVEEDAPEKSCRFVSEANPVASNINKTQYVKSYLTCSSL